MQAGLGMRIKYCFVTRKLFFLKKQGSVFLLLVVLKQNLHETEYPVVPLHPVVAYYNSHLQ